MALVGTKLLTGILLNTVAPTPALALAFVLNIRSMSFFELSSAEASVAVSGSSTRTTNMCEMLSLSAVSGSNCNVTRVI